MEIANTIIMIVGFVVIGWWQRHQIKALKEQIGSQEGLIANLKQFNEIFDVKKLKEYTAVSEETIEKKKNLEIEKIKTELASELQEKADALKFASETFVSDVGWLLNILYRIIIYVHPDSRKKVLGQVEDHHIKTGVETYCDQMPYDDSDAKKDMFKKALLTLSQMPLETPVQL